MSEALAMELPEDWQQEEVHPMDALLAAAEATDNLGPEVIRRNFNNYLVGEDGEVGTGTAKIFAAEEVGAIALSLLNLKKMGFTLSEAMALPKREPKIAGGESLTLRRGNDDGRGSQQRFMHEDEFRGRLEH